ncbi:Malolactic regulator [Lacticaseibacillus rhamnosus]|uniref:Malolactic regulator n=1 Tax=Lacticaseibacillus rhamnosus TaxID=47715 RepID=A0AAX0K2U5_LACRH|nr:Malolactic regulator [Lacticaseibacillus rhamnosus]MCI9806508.1 Malolactic regulator [Lacticaseibacillus rhamnosus]MCI9809000.1 Malolactic regulator [Lacticaseibacillus rhamnosus]ONN75406.1 hypothetical protein BWR10_04100 [Lacticaseibacillus rhamnosus]PCL28845.1 Malolactic regulator [Lacticaseibacillus rhamnosus]
MTLGAKFTLTPITRSPAQEFACKDLSRNGQERAITSQAAYTPIPNRAGSRSLRVGVNTIECATLKALVLKGR